MSSATCFPALVMQMIAFVYAAKIQESRINCAFSTLKRFRERREVMVVLQFSELDASFFEATAIITKLPTACLALFKGEQTRLLSTYLILITEEKANF